MQIILTKAEAKEILKSVCPDMRVTDITFTDYYDDEFCKITCEKRITDEKSQPPETLVAAPPDIHSPPSKEPPPNNQEDDDIPF